MRKWAALTIGTAVLLGTGISLALTSSGTTSEYATIASFFLAVPVAAASVIAIAEARSKPKPGHHEEKEPDTIRTGNTTNNITSYGGTVHTGRSKAKIRINNSGKYQPDRPRRKP